MTAMTTVRDNSSPRCSNGLRKHAPLIVLVAGWSTLILYLITTGGMYDTPGTAPTSIIIANVVPAGLFILAYAFSSHIRAYIRTFDLSLLAGLHATRTVGFSFLVLAGMGELPWLFALPAGLGDIMTAVAAPFIAYYAATRTDFIKSNRFLAWNIFGLVDFLVALGTGGAARVLGPETVGAGMEPMGTLPLIIIPALLVPMLMLTHLIMLIRAYEERKKERISA